MRRREFISLLGGAAAWPFAARAQQRKLARIGALVLTSADAQSLGQALWEGLREFGYAEGQNFALEFRSADGNADRLPDLPADLARLPVDVIVATFTPCALAATQATTTIPIVMAAVADPVGAGLVQSLARAGGNSLFLQHGRRDGRKKRRIVAGYAAFVTLHPSLPSLAFSEPAFSWLPLWCQNQKNGPFSGPFASREPSFKRRLSS